jgi:hypothetical protein
MLYRDVRENGELTAVRVGERDVDVPGLFAPIDSTAASSSGLRRPVMKTHAPSAMPSKQLYTVRYKFRERRRSRASRLSGAQRSRVDLCQVGQPAIAMSTTRCSSLRAAPPVA